MGMMKRSSELASWWFSGRAECISEGVLELSSPDLKGVLVESFGYATLATPAETLSLVLLKIFARDQNAITNNSILRSYVVLMQLDFAPYWFKKRS